MAKILEFSPIDAKLDRANFLPTNALANMSQTNHAYTCFVEQQFSSTLQEFMINYVMSVSSFYSVYK